MERNDLLTSAEYWTTKVQTDLCELAQRYERKHRVDSARQLGISEQTFSRLLNCAYDQRLSKLIKLSLAMGYAPVIEFKNIHDFLKDGKSE